MSERKERRHLTCAAKARTGDGDPIDRVNFERMRLCGVRCNRILELTCFEWHWLGHMLEKIHDRRAAQAECTEVDALLENGIGTIKENDHFSLSLPTATAHLTPTLQIKKGELGGEYEKLCQQTITEARRGRIRQ